MAEPVTRSGGKSVAWVIATAPYAKYQEFGTAHNAAHPFLRPAAEESRDKVANIVGAKVASASRTRLGKYEIEVVVPIGVLV
jgi:HK97 gp10 family phage protein